MHNQPIIFLETSDERWTIYMKCHQTIPQQKAFNTVLKDNKMAQSWEMFETLEANCDSSFLSSRSYIHLFFMRDFKTSSCILCQPWEVALPSAAGQGGWMEEDGGMDGGMEEDGGMDG